MLIKFLITIFLAEILISIWCGIRIERDLKEAKLTNNQLGMRVVKANMLELKMSESDKKIIDSLKLQAVNSDGSLTDLGRYLLIKYDSEKANDRRSPESIFNIPDEVKIGFKDYKVNKVDQDVVSDNKVCYGEIQYDNGEINISTKYNTDMQNCALIHEVIHGIDNIFEIGLDEDQVRILGKGVYAFIKDNPKIFIGLKNESKQKSYIIQNGNGISLGVVSADLITKGTLKK